MKPYCIPSKVSIKSISQYTSHEFIIECVFELFTLTTIEKYHEKFVCNIYQLNKIIRNEKGYLWSLFEEDLLEQLQHYNPDFIYDFSMPNEEALELSACEIIIGNELEEDIEFDRIIDVFPKFSPDIEKYVSFVHEFRVFNKALAEITIGILKCNYLQQRGYSEFDSIVLTNLNNPFAQELIKCLHEHKKLISEDCQTDKVCEYWHYNMMYGIDDSDEDIDEIFNQNEDKLDDLPF